MGIPYSKEISRALEALDTAYGQITPLIASGYSVLETTKNISLLLAAIQVLTVVLLGLILLALIGGLILLYPNMEKEQRELVTPKLKWITGWMYAVNIGLGWFAWIAVFLAVLVLGMSVVATRSGEWVKRKVEESVKAGQRRLEQRRAGKGRSRGRVGNVRRITVVMKETMDRRR